MTNQRDQQCYEEPKKDESYNFLLVLITIIVKKIMISVKEKKRDNLFLILILIIVKKDYDQR